VTVTCAGANQTGQQTLAPGTLGRFAGLCRVAISPQIGALAVGGWFVGKGRGRVGGVDGGAVVGIRNPIATAKGQLLCYTPASAPWLSLVLVSTFKFTAKKSFFLFSSLSYHF
jgi:hypothetical protein